MLDLRSLVNLLDKMADDYIFYTSKQPKVFPSSFTYKIEGDDEDNIESKARKAALISLTNNGIKKIAFDTRKINQENERNPRQNLQFYHRSQAFIDAEEQNKIELFAKLNEPLSEIKQIYGNDPEYLTSYARILHETLDNTLKLKEGHLDVFKPQMEYLSQILYLRYRLSMEDLSKMSNSELKNRILEKDEKLLKRGTVVHNLQKESVVNKTTQNVSPDNLVQAIFGAPNLRQAGEKTVERTITITIKDSVIE